MPHLPNATACGPLAIFDSGYGGLTVFKAIAARLPQYDYIYLGDNARAPYGDRSFETIHEYTWQCVQWLLDQGSPLVIIACNTASARALRTIQQQDLPRQYPGRRILGVIRPTAEVVGHYTRSGKIGVLGTNGTVHSGSYLIEIGKLFPDVTVYQQACPMFVPLIESGNYNSAGMDYFVAQYTDQLLQQSAALDTVVLACTHYPLIEDKIRARLPAQVSLLSQGALVADSLAHYLERHPETEACITREGRRQFFTTDATTDFDRHGALFFGAPIRSEFVHLV